MKKRILIIFASVLVVAMLTLPMPMAFAEKPMTYKLGLFAGMFTGGFSDPEPWVSGNIRHGRGAAGVAPTFYIGYPVGNLLVGSATSIWDYDVNVVTGKGNAHNKWVIVIGGSTPDPSDDGTFEGYEHIHGIFTFLMDKYANPYTTHSYGVLRGTGAYQGWKIILDTSRVEGGTPEYNNYIFTR